MPRAGNRTPAWATKKRSDGKSADYPARKKSRCGLSCWWRNAGCPHSQHLLWGQRLWNPVNRAFSITPWVNWDISGGVSPNRRNFRERFSRLNQSEKQRIWSGSDRGGWLLEISQSPCLVVLPGRPLWHAESLITKSFGGPAHESIDVVQWPVWLGTWFAVRHTVQNTVSHLYLTPKNIIPENIIKYTSQIKAAEGQRIID